MGEEIPMPWEERERRYNSYLEFADKLAKKLEKKTAPEDYVLAGELAELQFFALPECCMEAGDGSGQKGVVGKLKSIFNGK